MKKESVIKINNEVRQKMKILVAQKGLNNYNDLIILLLKEAGYDGFNNKKS